MLYVLYGSDELSLQRRIRGLREAADGGSGMGDSNLTVLDARDASADAVLAAALAMPFLAPRRLVIVELWLDRFGSGAEDRSSRALESLEPLFVALRSGLPETTDLVITGGAAGARNPLLERLRGVPGCVVEEFRPPTREGVLDFIRREGASRGLRWRGGPSQRPLEPGEEWRRPSEKDPVALLASRFQSDRVVNTLAIEKELAKLSLFTMGREVTVDDVDLVCGGEQESNVFQLVDAMMDGDVEGALRVLDYLRRKGESMQGVLALIPSGYRRLVTILDLLEEGIPRETIGKTLNLSWERLREQVINRAERHGIEGVRRAYQLIVETDRRAKLGEVDEDIGMEVLILELAALAPAGSARRARRQPR